MTMVILLSMLFLSGSILNFSDASGNTFGLAITGDLTDQTGKISLPAENQWPLTIILILIIALSLLTIFLFKKRKVQLILAMSVIVLATGLIIAFSLYAYKLTNSSGFKIIPGLRMTIPVFDLILAFLAWRGILKDERLVRSYDRLR
jgi:hypothetical protein